MLASNEEEEEDTVFRLLKRARRDEEEKEKARREIPKGCVCVDIQESEKVARDPRVQTLNRLFQIEDERI